MKLFRILIAFDALGLLALLYFFLDGLRYATNGDYFGIWAVVLVVPAGMLAWAWSLKGKGNLTGANILLGVLSVPFAFALFFVGLFIVAPPDFK